jgi:hypothetical protein
MATVRRLELVAVAAIVSVAVVLAVPVTPVRAVFAVPLCLVLPGYAVVQAIFAERELANHQTVMLALAVSLGTLALGALVLDLLPEGLTTDTWAALLLVVVLGACAVAWRRRGPSARRHRSRRGAMPRQSALGRRSRPAPERLGRARVRPFDGLLLGLGLLVAVGAFVASRIPLEAPNAIGYTQLWMLPSSTARSVQLRIGVSSAEQRPTTYRLILRTGTRATAVVASRLVLRPGQSAEFVVPLKTSRVPVPTLITADLFRTGRTGVYRHVTAVLLPQVSREGTSRLGAAGP